MKVSNIRKEVMVERYSIKCSNIEQSEDYEIEVDGKNSIDAILNMLEQINTGVLDLSTFHKESSDRK